MNVAARSVANSQQFLSQFQGFLNMRGIGYVPQLMPADQAGSSFVSLNYKFSGTAPVYPPSLLGSFGTHHPMLARLDSTLNPSGTKEVSHVVDSNFFEVLFSDIEGVRDGLAEAITSANYDIKLLIAARLVKGRAPEKKSPRRAIALIRASLMNIARGGHPSKDLLEAGNIFLNNDKLLGAAVVFETAGTTAGKSSSARLESHQLAALAFEISIDLFQNVNTRNHLLGRAIWNAFMADDYAALHTLWAKSTTGHMEGRDYKGALGESLRAAWAAMKADRAEPLSTQFFASMRYAIDAAEYIGNEDLLEGVKGLEADARAIAMD